ncbi:hypothetical protein [Streptomyces sp. H34-S4]|uniref:hypothetical protein n=1 Tax=Streptomyces sp. H34-S4 TaxID=2996463 RepID=UPI00226DC064|nr:hypothetical protein [Streptomyces sp. H34-S4]MCY0939515.1 hypothetical protein [Streptomyces sp. H34-S4]
MAAALTAPPAYADTPTQCSWSNPARYSAFTGGDSYRLSYCPLWRNHVPVYGTNSVDTKNWIVGYLEVGGYANWFVCQESGDYHEVNGWSNNLWAYTQADNGKWGWVSQVEFSGGGPGVWSSNLEVCRRGL